MMHRTEHRVELMEIWAREVISRKTQANERGYQTQVIHPGQQTPSLADDARAERAASIAQDFIHGIAAFGECDCKLHKYLLDPSASTFSTPSTDDHSFLKDKPGDTHPSCFIPTPFSIEDPRPLPPSPLGLISKYMRLLHAIRYTAHATLPPWANPEILIADEITLEFRFHEALRKEHLVCAMQKAVCKIEGRMGRVERDVLTGITKVVLFVDVADCVLAVGERGGCEEEMDPVPRYERGEGPPAYVEA